MTKQDDPIAFLCRVCEKPGMYVVSRRFDTVWSFIEGYDVAHERKPLWGFREWLSMSREDWTNAPWFVLVRERVFSRGTRVDWVPDEHEHAPLIAETRRLLGEFGAARRALGIEALLGQYQAWEDAHGAKRQHEHGA